jgi:hypothetical protein
VGHELPRGNAPLGLIARNIGSSAGRATLAYATSSERWNDATRATARRLNRRSLAETQTQSNARSMTASAVADNASAQTTTESTRENAARAHVKAFETRHLALTDLEVEQHTIESQQIESRPFA